MNASPEEALYALALEKPAEKRAAVQMIDVHLPTTDGRHVILSRYTQPEKELRLLLHQLKLTLPEQPPPRITSAGKLTD